MQLLHGDCFRHFARLEDASIDAVITDPPYGSTDAPWDHRLDLARWWQLIERKLKPSGVVVAFACGRFTFELYASRPKLFRYDLVWEKSKAVGHLWANHQPLRAHESILVFAKHLKRAAYNPQKTPSGKPPLGKIVHRAGKSPRSMLYHGDTGDWVYNDDGTRHPRSVLRFDSIDQKSGRLHPTQKPLDLMRWLVRTYSMPGQLVADPFYGSGTTAEACLIEGRSFVGCERERHYVNFARKRIAAASAQLHAQQVAA